MKNLILGRSIPARTGSVLILALFGSLQRVGAVVAPSLGMGGDRIGHRTILCTMRVHNACLNTALSFVPMGPRSGSLRPAHVIIIAALSGVARRKP